MAGSDAFGDKLKAALDTQASPLYQEAYERLKKIAESIARTVSQDRSKAEAVLKLGYRVDSGQQIRVVLRLPARDNFETTLFRAYIPVNGFPVSFDFLGETMVKAQSANEMEDKVLAFLTQAEMAVQLKTYREMAVE